jgi:general secretion pathway protein G
MQPYPLLKHSSLKQGFSLIEMLLVLGMIGLILGMIVANFQGVFGGAQEDVAKQFVDNSLSASLMQYKMHMGNYPSTQEGIKALIEAPSNKNSKRWKGPYIKKIQLDPWKNEYQYKFPGEKNPRSYDLWSMGADGVASEDDIGNWETD